MGVVLFLSFFYLCSLVLSISMGPALFCQSFGLTRLEGFLKQGAGPLSPGRSASHFVSTPFSLEKLPPLWREGGLSQRQAAE